MLEYPLEYPDDPNSPSPEIEPGQPSAPEIDPLRIPAIPQKANPAPEIMPLPSPDATPPQRETEIMPPGRELAGRCTNPLG